MILCRQPFTKTGKGKRSSENRENLNKAIQRTGKAEPLSDGMAVVRKNCEHLEARTADRR